MATELSVSMRERIEAEAATAVASPPENATERRIVRPLCEPLLDYIPASVHPNAISIATHALAWVTTALAIASVSLTGLPRSLALIGAGVGMFVSMIGDCLDGMHARRTNQCSKLGEMMDHWLDAAVVPLVTIASTMALQMEPLPLVIVNVTAAMVYHSQLVVYHHTGEFSDPETTSGMEAQFGLSFGFLGIGMLFYFVDPQTRWVRLVVTAIACTGIYIQMKCNYSYYKKMGRWMWRHLIFVAMGFAFGGLYLAGAIDTYAFLAAILFTSFRICGTYVLNTVLGRPYDGHDFGIVGFIVAIAAAAWLLPPVAIGGTTLLAVLPYVACAYMIARNTIDFVRDYPKLRSA
jgi:phosphatidylglycerophosphate synthase